MADTQHFTLNPGDKINFLNQGAKAIRIRVVTSCETTTIATLHPGAGLEMTVGRSSATVEILDAEEGYSGLKLIR